MTREWGDDIFDRRCIDEEIEDAADEAGMTVAEYRDYCQAQRDDAAIDALVWNRED
jgi:hypothetical protein